MTTITTTAERFKDGQSSSVCLTLPCVKSLNILQLETCHIRIHLWSRNRHESTIQSRYYLSLSLCLSLALTCFPLTLIHFSVLIAGWLPSVRFRQFQCGFPSMIFSVFPLFSFDCFFAINSRPPFWFRQTAEKRNIKISTRCPDTNVLVERWESTLTRLLWFIQSWTPFQTN